MKIYQSRIFAKKVKKLSKPEKGALDEIIKMIASNPAIGTEKKGDLRGIFVHKFKIKASLYLLSYRFTVNEIELIMLGPHENYYRDLKKCVK
jgi:mRNA-degrading endonuclease RelE of RelBE toxin-antitoxin system